MTFLRNPPPDELDDDRLIGRVQGDALQLAGLVRDYGPGVLHHLFDVWGPDHLRRVTIALAAAVNDQQRASQLWAWLDEPTHKLSTTIQTNQIWADLAVSA